MKAVIAICSVVLLGGPTWAVADAGKHHEHHDATFGKPGNTSNVSRTVDIDMDDTMRFTPGSIAVKKGETVRFVIKNSGKVKHEMVLGSEKMFREHAELMKKSPEMEHDEPNQIVVDPGKSGELIWQFTRAGKVDFACLQPGHFEAGMRGNIVVR